MLDILCLFNLKRTDRKTELTATRLLLFFKTFIIFFPSEMGSDQHFEIKIHIFEQKIQAESIGESKRICRKNHPINLKTEILSVRSQSSKSNLSSLQPFCTTLLLKVRCFYCRKSYFFRFFK